MIALVCLVFVTIVVLGITYKVNISPMDKDDKTPIEVVIPEKTSVKEIGKILEEKKLIRSSTFFNIYVKLFGVGSMKATTYYLSRDMDLKEIIKTLEKGNSYNPNEISITFKEGINMREVALVIEKSTNNSYDSVIEKANDTEYIDSLIEKYWFITDDIKNENIYYKLEGYLFPDTYNFKSKDVTVEEIFNKMLDEMGKKLEPYKEQIEESNMSVHEIITLASMIQEETINAKDYPKNAASVFVNRINRGMSLGSDVTTRYALKIDDPTIPLNDEQFNTKNPYNTRLTDGSMNGKLPVGPICTISTYSLEAAINPAKTDYIYFISNIKTKEMFFYNNSRDFEKKKAELNSVNNGL